MGRTSLKGILCAAFQLSVKSCKEASIHLLYFCFEFIYCFWETILGCAQGLCLWLTVFRVHSWRFIKGPYGKPKTKPRSCVCKASILPPLTQVLYVQGKHPPSPLYYLSASLFPMIYLEMLRDYSWLYIQQLLLAVLKKPYEYRDCTYVGCMQAKHPACSTIASASRCLFRCFFGSYLLNTHDQVMLEMKLLYHFIAFE